MKRSNGLWMLVSILCMISIIAVLRRILTMNGLVAAATMANKYELDNEFNKHPFLTYVHIGCGALFILLGPFQFMAKIRRRRPFFHRISGWGFVFAAYIIGLSSLALPFIIIPVGGFNERVATLFFAVILLVSITYAIRSAIHKNFAKHREWMIRAFSLGLAVASIRIINVLFFIFSKESPKQFFGTAFWLGFSVHLLFAEIYINLTKDKKLIF